MQVPFWVTVLHLRTLQACRAKCNSGRHFKGAINALKPNVLSHLHKFGRLQANSGCGAILSTCGRHLQVPVSACKWTMWIFIISTGATFADLDTQQECKT